MAKPTTVATQKYNEKMYDRITVYVKKGEKKKFAELAAQKGFTKPNAFYTKLLYDAADWTEPTMDDIRPVKIPNDAVSFPSYFIDSNKNIYCYRDVNGNVYAKDSEGNVIYFDKSNMSGGCVVNKQGVIINAFE